MDINNYFTVILDWYFQLTELNMYVIRCIGMFSGLIDNLRHYFKYKSTKQNKKYKGREFDSNIHKFFLGERTISQFRGSF